MQTTEDAATIIASAVHEWDRGSWCLAALGLASQGADTPLTDAARDVLAAAGLSDTLLTNSPFSPAQIGGMASSSLLKPAALVSGQASAWAEHSDDTLRAQGQASGSAGALFARFVLPHHRELGQRLASPGARMLDVGTGIGAIAVGFAQVFPQLHVTGIDVLPRALELARETITAAGLTARVCVLQQDVADLDESAAYDLIWLPAPFVPESALREGTAGLAAALRPGGMLLIGHGRYDGAEIDNALTRFQTLSSGGTPLDASGAVQLLGAVGLTSVRTVPSPPGAPALTAGLRAGVPTIGE